MLRGSIICLVVLIGLNCESASAQLPWRGRYVRRDGLFHVERMHWGGGITANGAAVAQGFFAAAVPIASSLIGKEEPERDNAQRAAPNDVLCSAYTAELKRANDLLERAENLLGTGQQNSDTTPPGSSVTPPPVEVPSGGTPIGPEFGTEDPWKTSRGR